MVQKFQLGGVVNPISTFRPINIETASKRPSGAGQPRQQAFTPTAPDVSSSSSGSSTDPLKGALESDRRHLLNRRNNLMNEMQNMAITDPNYFENGGASLAASAAQEQGQLEGLSKAKAEQFKMLKAKFANSGDEIASDGSKVLVKDLSGNYSIVPYQEAATKKDKNGKAIYEPQTVSTALNLRMSDENFSGYTEQGAAIEDIIGGVTDSTKFNATMQKAFKSAGSVAGDVFINSVGDEIPMQDLIDSIKNGSLTSKSKPLKQAVESLTSNLSAGETKHLRTQAWEDYRKMKPMTNNPSAWVEDRMQDILESNALSYLKTSYHKGKTGTNKEDKAKENEHKELLAQMKETLTISELDYAKMAPGDVDTTIQTDSVYKGLFYDLGGGDAQITFKTSVVASDKTAKYTQYKKENQANDFRRNPLINSIGTGATLVDGTPLSKVAKDSGEGYGVTIVPNSPIKVLHDVPMKYDDGKWVIARNYMAFYSLLGDKIKEETAKVIEVQTRKLGNKDLALQYVSKYRDAIVAKAKKIVLDEVKKHNKEKPNEKLSIPDPNEKIASKTVAMLQILTRVDDDPEEDDFKYLNNFTAPEKGGITADQAEFYAEQIMSDSSEAANLQDKLGKGIALIPLGSQLGTGGDYFDIMKPKKRDIMNMLANSSFRGYKFNQ